MVQPTKLSETMEYLGYNLERRLDTGKGSWVFYIRQGNARPYYVAEDRTEPLSAAVAAYMRRYKNEERTEYLFVSSEGETANIEEVVQNTDVLTQMVLEATPWLASKGAYSLLAAGAAAGAGIGEYLYFSLPKIRPVEFFERIGSDGVVGLLGAVGTFALLYQSRRWLWHHKVAKAVPLLQNPDHYVYGDKAAVLITNNVKSKKALDAEELLYESLDLEPSRISPESFHTQVRSLFKTLKSLNVQ